MGVEDIMKERGNRILQFLKIKLIQIEEFDRNVLDLSWP